MRMKTVEVARGHWRSILSILGADPRVLDGRHHACPWCGGKDRFRFDDKDGSGSYFCSGCGPGHGVDFVMHLRSWDFATAAREIDAILGNLPAEPLKQGLTSQQKMLAIRRLLKSAGPVAPGTPAAMYLERRCGALEALTSDLRFHPALRHAQDAPGRFPALLAILRYPDGRGASVHRTYLTANGQKADVDPVRKIMPGLPLEGSAVRLGPFQEHLGIAEGLETALCAGKLFGLPVWSAISASGILHWVPPPGVRSVVICADNDANFVGQAAAYDAAKRLRAKGLEVEIKVPSTAGSDWADVWAETQSTGGRDARVL